MTRENQVLTAEARADRDDFDSMDYGGCACHLGPPCDFCVHPGNPYNQDDFDGCWQFESIDDRLEDVRVQLHKMIDRM